MHSSSGALSESLLKHVYPSKILEREEESIYVLDIGFGLGYNILALIDEFQKRKKKSFLKIISLENDFSYLSLLKEISFPGKTGEIYDLIKAIAEGTGEFNDDRLSIKIIPGDARESIKRMSGMFFDAIFHDPFSPSKNPELWSVEFFIELFRLAADHGILTTYSSAPQIRMALLSAGFRIGRGPAVGKKREGTLAAKGGQITSLQDQEINDIINNIKSAPYRDHDLNESRENILAGRIDEMKQRRIKKDHRAR